MRCCESDQPPSHLISFMNLIKEVLQKVKVIMIIGSELVKMINLIITTLRLIKMIKNLDHLDRPESGDD